MRHVNVVFDGPPGQDSPRLIEVEDENGRSLRLGEWVRAPDGRWHLRFTAEDVRRALG